MSLTLDLKARASQSLAKYPKTTHTVMSNAIQALVDEGLVNRALKTGDKIPEIVLSNATGKQISIQELLPNKKVILSFYRGGWCPYCNLELKALQQAIHEFDKHGATLVAISPETPDNSLNTQEKNELNFEVLSDQNNLIANAFNLTFTLPEDLIEIYKGFGIDLDQSNGNTDWQLPISATYLIDHDGTILYDFIKEDYKERADPKEIIKVLNQR